MAKSRARKMKRTNKKTPPLKKILTLIMIGVFVVIYGLFPKYREFQEDRQQELKFAYLYCADKIIRLEGKEEKRKMVYYYDVAEKIRSKIKDTSDLNTTRTKVEKIYWAKQ